MSTVADPTSIDMVTANHARGDRVTLVIQVPLTWDDGGPDQLQQLIAKFNGYLHWIQRGQCVQAYPAAAAGVDILISCMDQPTGDAAGLVQQIHDAFAKRYGIGVGVVAARDR